MASSEDVDRVTEILWGEGIYVTVAAYPLVPRYQVGFRIQVTAAHTDEEIDGLLGTIDTLAREGLLRTVYTAGPYPSRGTGRLLRERQLTLIAVSSMTTRLSYGSPRCR